MTFKEALKKGESYLQEHQVIDALIDAWYLMQYVLKNKDGSTVDRSWFFLHGEEQMAKDSYEKYQTLLSLRGTHIPLQHLTGEQEFMGLSFKVNEHVLIPRQDTEILVEEAMKVLQPGMEVLDMCTGSGCIIVSLMKLVSGILGEASDISMEALSTAMENARCHQADVKFYKGDLYETIEKTFDVIVSNPPYIPTGEIESLMEEVRCFDPITALDGKEDGLYFYRRLVKESVSYLKPGGWLLMEIGCEQGADVVKFLGCEGFKEIKVVKDLAGLDRVVAGRRE